jgi:hypothetical protein
MSAETIDQTDDLVYELIVAIQSEPESKDILYKTLQSCETARTASHVESQIKTWATNRTILHKPHALLSLLIKGGGLQQSKGEKGQIILKTTPVGLKAIATICPSNLITDLFVRDAKSKETYLAILKECIAPKSLDELEDIFPQPEIADENNALVSYFLGELEDAGAIEWNIKWHTTIAGHKALQQMCS